MTSGRPPFRYSVEEKELLLATWPTRALHEPISPWRFSQIERDGDAYIFAMSESDRLPTIDHLRARRETELEHLRAVRAMLFRDEKLTAAIHMHRAEIWAGGDSPTSALCKLFLSDRISSVPFESEIAAIAIDFLISQREEGSYDEAVKTSGPRDTKHRDRYIANLVERWAEMNETHVSRCTVSDDGPMMRFMEAALGPVLAVTGEKIGSRMIRNIVDRVKAETVNLEMKAAE